MREERGERREERGENWELRFGNYMIGGTLVFMQDAVRGVESCR